MRTSAATRDRTQASGAPARFSRLAQVGLLPAAAFAVHELRYVLAYGGHVGAELQRTGHSYLHSLVPWIILLLALARCNLLGRREPARSGRGAAQDGARGVQSDSKLTWVSSYLGQQQARPN